MNKYWFGASIVIVTLFMPLKVDAIGGACSSHNGVNCLSGRQLNGNVYCNDGWTESIAEYDFMVMCKNYKYSCNLEEWKSLSQKYSLENIFFQLQNIIDNSDSNYFFQIQYNAVKNQYDSALNLAERECEALGADRASQQNYEKTQSDFYNTQIKAEQDKLEQLKQQEQEINKNYLDALNELNNYASTCPANSTLVGNSCRCNTGYFVYSDFPNKCITPTDACKLTYGDHIFASDAKCICESGYVWNGSKCVELSKTSSGNENISIPEGAIIRAENGIDVYIVKYIGTKKFKRLVLSPSVFKNYGHLKWENLMVVSQSTLDSFTTSELVRAVGDSKIYKLYPQGDTGQKRLIKDTSVLTKLGLDPDSIYEINSFDRESYITGTVLE